MGSARIAGRAPQRSASSRFGTARPAPLSPAAPAFDVESLVVPGIFDVGSVLSSDRVLQLQRSAGNRAVRELIQRAAGPLDDTVPGMALADTAQPAPPTPTSASEPSAQAPAPTGSTTAAASVAPGIMPTGSTTATDSVAPGLAPSGGAAPAAGGPAGGRPIALGGPVPAGSVGGVDQTAKRVPLRRDAVPVPEHAVETAFDQRPDRVLRSPSDEWHFQVWNFQKGPGWDEEPPPAFRSGDLIVVAPGYGGRATPMPAHSGDERTGLGSPAATVPTPLDTTAPPTERPMIWAIAPGFSPGPERAGRPTAEAASHEDVVAALAANPRSVVRSPNEAWHQQGYELDRGTGAPPKAYKVEGVIIVAPDYPIEGIPEASAASTPAAATGTAGAPAGATGTGVTPATGPTPVVPATGSTRTASEVSGPRVRTDVSVTKGAPGVAVDMLAGGETTEGDTTTKTERGGTGSIGGGSVVSAGGKQVTTATTGGTATTTTTGRGAALKPDGSLDLSGGRGQETVVTDAHGNQTKTATSMKVGINVGEKGVGVKAGASTTNAAGSTHGVTGGAKVDPSGNVSGELGYSYKTKGGTSLTPSVSGGVEVRASDPIPAKGGGFDVTYTMTSSSGVSVGASKEVSGGPSVGVNLGSTEASLQTGSRHFADEKAAKDFRDHAAAVIVRDQVLQLPPTTAAGALQIPIGEERGTGDVSGSSIGGSVSLEGASVGYGRSSSTTHTFSVRRVSQTEFEVTGLVSGTKGSDWSISGGLSNTKGGSTTTGFSVTWSFDLGSSDGRDAFERYANTGIPPLVGATMKSVTKSGSDEDHDIVSIPLMGTARWTGSTWEIDKTDAAGTHEQFGGEKSHDQDPSWFGRHVLDQDEQHSSAQIVSSVESGPGGKTSETHEAQVKTSGESGDYNREKLGDVFGDTKHGDTKASGDWTLSAEVSPAVIRELSKVNPEMRAARTKEERLRVYSKLVKENGARMVAAQVGLGGDATAWNVELKGDKNFPGADGRAELERRRAALKQRLRGDPTSARAVAAEAQQVLDELEARRKAVADESRYTDLPEGLREEQLKLIAQHIEDFTFIRHAASQEAVKAVPGEKIEDVRGRMSDKKGYKGAENTAEGAEMARLRDRIADAEARIKEIDPRILEAINAVMKAESHTIVMPSGFGDFARQHRADYNLHWDAGSNVNDRQMAMAPKADELRMKLLEYLAPADRIATAKALLSQLEDRLKLLKVLLGEVMAAAEALEPITTAKGKAGHEPFWAGVKSDATPGADGGSD